MIKIGLIYSPNYTAITHYRMEMPHSLIMQGDKDFKIEVLQTDGTIETLTDEQLKEYNFIIANRYISLTGKTKEQVDRLHRLGVKLVLDIDDYWVLPKHHKLFKSYEKYGHTQSMVDALTHADYVMTTTKMIADKCLLFNKNVIIIPNVISPLDLQWKRVEIANDRVRFGWVGGVYHYEDIRLMEKCFTKLSYDRTLHNDIQISVAGFNLNGITKEKLKSYEKYPQLVYVGNGGLITGAELIPEYFKIEKVITNNYKLINYDKHYRDYLEQFTPALEHIGYDKPYRRIWAKDLRSYAQVYNELDVCLVPLVNDEFSSCKSELKIIEAGTMGKCVIVSDVSPYKEFIKDGENGLIADDWYEDIEYLVANPEHRKDMALALSETIDTYFNPIAITNMRIEFYKTFAS